MGLTSKTLATDCDATNSDDLESSAQGHDHLDSPAHSSPSPNWLFTTSGSQDNSPLPSASSGQVMMSTPHHMATLHHTMPHQLITPLNANRPHYAANSSPLIALLNSPQGLD